MSTTNVLAFRRSGFTLLRFKGIPVTLGYTWLLLAAVVVIVYAPIVQRSVPGLSVGAALVVAALFALTLLVSVFLHELGHALVSLRAGIGVRRINLDALGGFTEMDREAPRPGTAAAIALAGPAVSAALGGIGLAGLFITVPGSLSWQLSFQVCVANLLVAVYNLLPGLPLDGGKALQAGIWAATGDRWTGYRVAGWAGRVVALATLAAGLWLFTARWFSGFGLILLVFVAFELWRGASSAIRAARMGPRVKALDAAALARPVALVPAAATLGEALATAAGREVVAVDGRPVGVLDRAAADAVPADQVGAMPLAGLLRSATSIPGIEADLKGQALVDAIGRTGAERFFVVDEGRLTGLLYTADVVKALR
ncbi:site-2 protease family protein [Glycomyces sp. TRM65418]|uniref:M50 family metallopeptidase n=1 Tax=Glycomyces sp. TRM65418 TaxID=2867006 RepID=UPI001CE553E8|nr:M50 family metallopeptidase [Glycomyces sp. TRM65418]MCC3763022.1 site-2 protease family protein [Glycomyces sp. TRM65418]QZD57037.1 site-2 protease family protein [Glycomyces sp. TRM65418]